MKPIEEQKQTPLPKQFKEDPSLGNRKAMLKEMLTMTGLIKVGMKESSGSDDLLSEDNASSTPVIGKLSQTPDHVVEVLEHSEE